jgi:ribonuclease HII
LRRIYQFHCRFIVGVDEAGRGPIAGPVSAAALVCLPDHVNLIQAADSKVLSEKKREEIYELIREDPTISYSFSFVNHTG